MINEFNFIEVIETFQGEGIDTGKRAILVRFKECSRLLNLGLDMKVHTSIIACPFCDTLVKMRLFSEGYYSLECINNLLQGWKLLMITGGEPGFYFEETKSLVEHSKTELVNIETNGYKLEDFLKEIKPGKQVSFMYSPKLFSEKDLEQNLDLTKKVFIESWPSKADVFLKVVYGKGSYKKFTDRFLDEIKRFVSGKYIWLMPEGATKETLVKNTPMVLDKIDELKCNFSSRVHILHEFI